MLSLQPETVDTEVGSDMICMYGSDMICMYGSILHFDYSQLVTAKWCNYL